MRMVEQALKAYREAAQAAQSWPFEEARRVLTRTKGKVPEKGYILLETGYGPSGLPHIGTFGEVARTVMVQHALQTLSDIPTRLFCFSDDMDGLRKVPDNVPHPEWLQEHLGQPLTEVPDPYEKYPSFGEHNNAMLQEFLDSFGFRYEFQSATQHYKAGDFDAMLLNVLRHYDEIMALILPTLRDERRVTYSPFLPICPTTHQVLQVAMESIDPDAGTVTYKDPVTSRLVEVPVTGGACKLQWKVDWGGRWFVFGVDYEMFGKDLISSYELSSQICAILGGCPPEHLFYELFLDQNSQKISKSKGNGLTIQEWLKYAPHESLAYYMFQAPRKAKRLYFDVIPRSVDDYRARLEEFGAQPAEKQVDNPVFHIHAGQPPREVCALTFNILLNLASVCGAEDEAVLWGFVQKYRPGVTAETDPFLAQLIWHTLAYYRDFIKPSLKLRAPTEVERTALEDLLEELEAMAAAPKPEGDGAFSALLQNLVFEIGKRHPFSSLRAWFQALYEVLLGSSDGPRLGSFIELYGLENMIRLIQKRLQATESSHAREFL